MRCPDLPQISLRWNSSGRASSPSVPWGTVGLGGFRTGHMPYCDSNVIWYKAKEPEI